MSNAMMINPVIVDNNLFERSSNIAYRYGKMIPLLLIED